MEDDIFRLLDPNLDLEEGLEDVEHEPVVTTMLAYTKQKPRVFVPVFGFRGVKTWLGVSQVDFKHTLLSRNNTRTMRNLAGEPAWVWPRIGWRDLVWVFDMSSHSIIVFCGENDTEIEIGSQMFQSIPFVKNEVEDENSHSARLAVNFLNKLFEAMKAEPANIGD